MMLNHGISTEKIYGYMLIYENDLPGKCIPKNFLLSSNV